MNKTEKEKRNAKKAQYKRQNEWQRENVERLSLVFPKGTKERIRSTGETLNGFVNECVKRELENRGV